MANENSRKKVFEWIVTACLEPNQLGQSGGAFVLAQVESTRVQVDVRPFQFDPVDASSAPQFAKTMADRIVDEAESNCEGRGGGEKAYVVSAYKQGERKVYAKRPFTVHVEPTGDSSLMLSMESSPTSENQLLDQALRIISQQREQQGELHRAIIDMAKGYSQGLPKIVEAQSAMIADFQKTFADNMALLKANVINREGREAEAFAKLQQAQDFKELKDLILPHLLPYAMKMLMSGQQGDGEGNGQG